MFDLTQKQLADFYHRSYTAVDGLWFMKVEEACGFEKALDIDDEVWKVLPKIQARMLKGFCREEDNLKALLACFTQKQDMEGFVSDVEISASGRAFTVTVRECPWHNAMIKSGREHLSGAVGTRICRTEALVWASEFGDNIQATLSDQICTGAEHCKFHFSIFP